MFAVVSTATAGPDSIGHIESVHHDLSKAVERQHREGAWMTRIVALEGRAKAGDDLGKGDGWRELDEEEREEALAYMDEVT